MISTELSTDTLKSMAAPISKKRKISCLSCRARKTKCDGEKPCAKCLLKGKSSECVYAQTSGPVGRPAKNAVINKMVLLSQTIDSRKQQFVYENLSFCGLNDHSKIFTNSSHRDHFSDDGAKLSDYISGIFSVYFGTGLRFDDLDTPAEESTALVDKCESIFQLFDLKQHYSWLASEGISNLVTRCSDLKLTNFRDLNVYGHLLKSDRSDGFFERKRSPTFTATVRQNPLKSLTAHQALQYTDVFFSVHPWAPFIINRTQVLQEYFTDECDPLLLSVIFGIAKYFAKQMSEGVVFSTVVRRGDRNEFLNYAHSILAETSAKTTVAKFQAVALLSYFEITYGQSKKGTTLTALSYVMLGKLAQTVDFKDKHLAGLGSLQRELVRNAWWCIYNNTVTGTIECKLE
jgi:Fungal Zn(2)-Cys(6) binuclear cluster domain